MIHAMIQGTHNGYRVRVMDGYEHPYTDGRTRKQHHTGRVLLRAFVHTFEAGQRIVAEAFERLERGNERSGS